MRTRVLLGLAALAVGHSTSMAQNVYSLNVVGFINITVGSGYTLCANQLNNGTNGITQVLANAPDNAVVLKFMHNDYKMDIAVGGAWYDNNTGDPSETTLNPGEGFFYNNPGATTNVTLSGEVPQGTGLAVKLPRGYALVGTYTPEALALSAANGFPMTEDTIYLKFENAYNQYAVDVIVGGAWYNYITAEPTTVVPEVGQGYFINNPSAATNWVRDFTVQ
jgi:hypothetical protein